MNSELRRPNGTRRQHFLVVGVCLALCALPTSLEDRLLQFYPKKEPATCGRQGSYLAFIELMGVQVAVITLWKVH